MSIRDIKNEKFDLTEKHIKFTCDNAENKTYEFETDFFAEIVPEASKWNKTGFHLLAALQKKDTSKPYWLRLTEANIKSQYIQCDWEKWIDEDEEEEEGDKGLAQYDPQNMQSIFMNLM